MDAISSTFNFLTPAEEAMLAQVPVTEESAPFIQFLKNPPRTFSADILNKTEQLRKSHLCPLFERIENGLKQLKELYKAVQQRVTLCEAGSLKSEIGKEIFASHFGSLLRKSSSSPTLRLTPKLPPSSSPSVNQSPSPIENLTK